MSYYADMEDPDVWKQFAFEKAKVAFLVLLKDRKWSWHYSLLS